MRSMVSLRLLHLKWSHVKRTNVLSPGREVNCSEIVSSQSASNLFHIRLVCGVLVA